MFLKHKVHLPWPIIPLSIYLQTSHTAEMLLKKFISKYPIHSYLESPEALGWELLFRHQPSPPLNLRIAIKWFSERDPEVAPEVEGTPRICQLQEAVFHQV